MSTDNESMSKHEMLKILGDLDREMDSEKIAYVILLQKWRAYIRVDGKRKHLGLFDTFDDAVAARKAAKIENNKLKEIMGSDVSLLPWNS